METVISNEAVAVPRPGSVYERILMELSELSPGQPRVITRPGSTSGYKIIPMKLYQFWVLGISLYKVC